MACECDQEDEVPEARKRSRERSRKTKCNRKEKQPVESGWSGQRRFEAKTREERERLASDAGFA